MAYSMVIRFFTLFTPFTSLTSLVTRSFSAAFLALPPQRDHAVLRLDRGVEGAGRAMVQQRHLDLGGDGSVIDLFTPLSWCLFRGLRHGHLIVYVFDPFDILGVFGRQFLLCLAGSIASQGHDAVFDVNLGLAGAHAPMEQECGFHFRTEPRIRVFGGGCHL